jgi:DNA-directed RNA polymerase subunit E'/Rpb7
MNNQTYFNTFLTTEISLHPSQMNNNIYKNLKEKLIKLYENKCFFDYGYICKIYKIEERHGGYIHAEDTTSSAMYKIKFSCKLCCPLLNSVVVFQVVAVNKLMIYLKNGPIIMIVFENSINMDNFVYDEEHNVWLAYSKNNKGKPIINGVYVTAIINDVNIENKTTSILALGVMEKLATDDEIMYFMENQENENMTFVNYSERDNDNDNVNVKNETETTEFVSETDTMSDI